MAEQAVRPSSSPAPEPAQQNVPGPAHRWRTVDIVVTAVLGVAFGVVFWAWNLLWAATGAAFAVFPPAQAFMYGVWLLPAVLAPLVVRKPGAGLFAELVAAVLSALLGSSWGSIILLYGLLQGLAGELGYVVFGWRRFGWPQALLSSLLAGAMAAVLDLVFYYPTWSAGWKVTYLAVVAASTVVVAGAGGTALVRALARTGALSSFASGRRV
jgi:energy-coupling factor transport system permease protein